MTHGDRKGHVLFVSAPGWERELYATALDQAGFDVRQADTVEAAVTGLEETHTTLIVMDLLPEPDRAWAFIERRTAATSDPPIVVFTPLIRPDGANRRRARSLGCAAFVAKPCSLRQLVTVVSRVQDGERGLEIWKYWN
jgi:two-component system phosphate regulon response regulator PhoB